LGVCALSASLLVAVQQDDADAARACKVPITTRLDKTEKFAGNGSSKYYYATAQGSVVGGYDHTGNVIMTRYAAGVYPSLMNVDIGARQIVGDMVKQQQPTAVSAIDGDFFSIPDIRYVNDIEMARGPMVRDGKLLRAAHQPMRAVGVDRTLQPFGGLLAVRGSAQAQVTGAVKVEVRSLNWQKVLNGGVSVYTPTWSRTLRADGKAATPRPAGTVEWVLNSHNKIKSIRTSTRNATKLGAPVADGTRVLAFSADTASATDGVPTGTKVSVNIKQYTDTGVKLQTAVGRGLELVIAGKPAPLGCKAYMQTPGASAARPRTIVGWDAQGRWRSFTVPGSKVEVSNGQLLRTGGFSLSNAANLAKKLGMTYAFELDGGGSTTLYNRTGTTWTRKDLYGVTNTQHCACERPVTNGLAFIQP